MARAPRNYVAEIGAEVALPIARAYCARWHLSYDPEAGEAMWWAGAFVDGALRAVVGLAPFADAFVVSGVFTDGSPIGESRGTRMIVDRLAGIPKGLVGTLHLPTQQTRRLFRKAGWQLSQGVV